jgi:serine/threonine protein kinase
MAAYTDENGLIIGELPSGYFISPQFRVCKTLGEGGMSFVYLCDDLSLKRQVAIKIMSAMAQLSDQSLMRFQREAQAVAMMNHNNIVRIHGLQFTERGQPFMVMDVVVGLSLSQLLEISGPLKLSKALRILVQICEGIEHAHAHGIIHRDLKLSNIMVTDLDRSTESIKILDFGIAKAADETSVKMTQTGEIFGSPAYMSPEQALGKKVDARTDQYSLGCIAFELLTGRTPFAAENNLVVLMAHVNKKAPSVNEFAKVPVPLDIERTIARMLAKEPNDRFQNIEDVRKTLSGETKAVSLQSIGYQKNLTGLRPLYNAHALRFYAGAIILCALIILVIVLSTRKNEPAHDLTANKISSQVETVSEKPENKNANYQLRNLILKNPNRQTFDDLLTHTKITDDGLRFLRECPYLDNLKLEGCTNITSAGMDVVAQLPITNLNLNKTELDDSALLTISKMKRLQELHLDNVDGITNKGIAYLVNMPSLQRLWLSDCFHADAETLKIISQFKELRALQMDSDDVTAGLHYLTDCRFSYLAMSHCSPKPETLLALSKINSLQVVVLDGDNVDTKTLLALAKLPLLNTLSIKGAMVSNDDIKKFKNLNSHCKLTYNQNPGHAGSNTSLQKLEF